MSEIPTQEILAQPGTIKKVTNEVKKRVRIVGEKDFQTTDPESGQTTNIELRSVYVHPLFPIDQPRHWQTRRNPEYHYRSQKRVGRAIFIDINEQQDVATETGTIDTQITPKQFRIDTTAFSANPPKLLISTMDQSSYLESQRAEYADRRLEHFELPKEEQWREATEAEAQELLGKISELKDDDEFFSWRDKTRSQIQADDERHIALTREKKERKTLLTKEVERIFAVGKDYIANDSLTLALGEKTVQLTKNDDGAIHITITSQDKTSNPTQEIEEKFMSLPGIESIIHYTSLNNNSGKRSETPQTDIDDTHKDMLFDTLASLTDETIKTELSTRSEITDYLEKILERNGKRVEEEEPDQFDEIVADFHKEPDEFDEIVADFKAERDRRLREDLEEYDMFEADLEYDTHKIYITKIVGADGQNASYDLDIIYSSDYQFPGKESNIRSEHVTLRRDSPLTIATYGYQDPSHLAENYQDQERRRRNATPEEGRTFVDQLKAAVNNLPPRP